MDFVIDCSVAIAWCFEDESSEWTDFALAQLEAGQALVPELWFSEMANVLVQCEKRGRLTVAQSSAFLHRVALLPIRRASLSQEEHFSHVVHLARKEDLSSYDATYLYLALREGLPLASLDRELNSAAKRTGVRSLKS